MIMPPREGHGALLMALLLTLLLPHAVIAQRERNQEGDRLWLNRSRQIIDERFQMTRAERERTVDCSEPCPHRTRGPVCGTNGHTYDSLCELDLDICRKVKVSLKHEGECTLAEKCLDERRAREEEVANGEPVHVPTCLEDGSYAPVQCHNFTRYCWCSSLDGMPIQATVQSDFSLPTCPKRCTGRSRRTFTTRLSKHFVKEFQRVRNTDRLSERKLLKRALKWKFSQLDGNRDKMLQRREYKQLQRTVRKYIKPKKCAKMFPRICDGNGDRSLTPREWVSCFTRVGKKGRIQDQKRKNKTTTPKPSGPSCGHERNKHGTQGTDTNSNISIPVYKCQPNGKYEPMQCFKGSSDVICICVDEWTGNSYLGTGVKNGTPDCSRPMPHARTWRGCTGEVKTKFMQDLQKFLLKKKEGGEWSVGNTQSVHEFAARYHFESLDTNNSSFLEGREKKMVKTLFKSNPKLKRCGRKMAKYCDVNYDKRVSMEEWVACVTVQHNDIDDGVAAPDPNNPFESLLKAEV